MPHWMPFTVHFKIHPVRLAKRMERVRELQRIAYFAYEGLKQNPALNIAMPGGGQARNYGQFSDLVYGTAVTPQFGESPAQLMITGFWDNSNYMPPFEVVQPQTQLIHAGEIVTGPFNNQPWTTNPSVSIQSQAAELTGILDSDVNSALPASVDPITVFRLDYMNIIWGDRGRSLRSG